MIALRAVVIGLGAVLALPGSVRVASGAEELTKAFAMGGQVRMDLAAGEYTIRAGKPDQIAITWTSDTPEGLKATKVDLQVRGSEATLVTDGPRQQLKVTIELPPKTGVRVKISAGDLRIQGIEGDKQVDSWAGNVEIDVGRADDYATVHGSVTAGNLDAGAFRVSKEGLFRSFDWKGPGKYKIDVRLTAGNLRLQ